MIMLIGIHRPRNPAFVLRGKQIREPISAQLVTTAGHTLIAVLGLCRVTRRTAAGHVVDDRIGVDLHARLVTALYHGDKLATRPAATGQLVAHRLIALVPGTPEQHTVLVRR